MTSGPWYPCEYPERPNDAWMRWHYRTCHGCHVAAFATSLRHPDDPSVAWVLKMTSLDAPEWDEEFA